MCSKFYVARKSAFWRSCIRRPYFFLVSGDSPSIEPSIYRLTSASTLTIGQQHLLAGYTTTPSHPPSPHNAAPSSSHRTPQIALQKADYHTDSLFLASQGGNAQYDQSSSSPLCYTEIIERATINPQETTRTIRERALLIPTC